MVSFSIEVWIDYSVMQGQFAVLSFKCNTYSVPKYTRMPYISLDSQKKERNLII